MSTSAGDSVIVKNAIKKKVHAYLAVVERIVKFEYLVQFLKYSSTNTYSAKEGDTTIINKPFQDLS